MIEPLKTLTEDEVSYYRNILLSHTAESTEKIVEAKRYATVALELQDLKVRMNIMIELLDHINNHLNLRAVSGGTENG